MSMQSSTGEYASEEVCTYIKLCVSNSALLTRHAFALVDTKRPELRLEQSPRGKIVSTLVDSNYLISRNIEDIFHYNRTTHPRPECPRIIGQGRSDIPV